MDFPYDDDDKKKSSVIDLTGDSSDEDNNNNNNNNNNNTKIERVAIPPPQKYSSAYCYTVQKKSEYEDEKGNVKNFWREWKRGDIIQVVQVEREMLDYDDDDWQGEEMAGPIQGVILVAKVEDGTSKETVDMPPRSFNWKFVLYKYEKEDMQSDNDAIREKIESRYNNNDLDLNLTEIKANEQDAMLVGHISLDFISEPFLDYGENTRPMTHEEVVANRKVLEEIYANEEANYHNQKCGSSSGGSSSSGSSKRASKRAKYKLIQFTPLKF